MCLAPEYENIQKNGEVMYSISKLLILSSALIVASQSNALAKSIEFSADAVIGVPHQAPRKSRLFVGKDAVRRESVINGQAMIEIVFPEKGRAVLINEQLKSYKERVFPHQPQDKDHNPCLKIKNAKCEKLGTESIDGLKTEKWQVITSNQGRNIRTLHWIDTKRKLAIREFFPDGTVSELKMIKNEKVNKRNTEKWQRTVSRPDGQVITSYQWYDSKLKIAIKEELPGGFTRELKNIQVSKQSDKLFNVPDDYMKINNFRVNHPGQQNIRIDNRRFMYSQ